MGQMTNGMDTDRIREIAGQLQQQAGKIQEVAQNGSQQQGTLTENWLGADCQAFGEAWSGAAKALQTANDALNNYAKAAIDQAQQQDDVSGGR